MNPDILVFFDKKSAALPLYEKFEKRVLEEVADVHVKVQKTQITFSNRHGFAFVSFLPVRKAKDRPEPYLTVTFGLSHRVGSPRIDAAVEPYPNRWTHHVMIGEPEVTKYICAAGKFSAEEIRKRLETEQENGRQFHVQYWPVFELRTGELVGCCGLRPHGTCAENGGESRIKEYEIGFHLRPEFWGQGYAAECAGAVIRYAFDTLGAEKLFAGHNPNNVRSKKVLAKLGFQYTGDEFYEPTGLYHPSYELRR